ncbi:MAG: DUF885 domain-containing protein [Candidatus Eisenbacteria bacterium]|nr:DUF885 domain-containing protein [Candidatus Eisenbacteria bacterium]
MEAGARARILFDEYFDYVLKCWPEYATAVGVHAYDHQLASYDGPSIDGKVRAFREFEKRAGELLAEQTLSIPERIDLSLIAGGCEMQVLEIEKMMKPWTDPTMYVETSLFALFLLTSRDVLPMEKRAQALAARLKEFVRVLAQARENLENPPRVFTTTALGMLKGATAFVNDVVPHFGREVPRLRAELEAASGACLKAIADFEAFVKDELLPRSSGDFAIGRELFETKMKVEHMIDLDAKTLEKMGRELLDRTRNEMERLSSEVAPGRNWKDVIDERKNNHPSAEGLRAAYEEHMKRARDFVVEKRLVSIPRGETLRVVDTPAFLRTIIPYAAYLSPGAFDEKQEGIFVVTPVDRGAPAEVQNEQLKGHSYPSMVLTSLHEAYPGHHLQLVWSNRVPSKIRQISLDTVFAEGWALYCEEMMKEEGFYESKEIKMFQLKDMLWRAARVVIDVGLHTRTMNFDEAVDFLVSEAVVERTNAVAEVTRYTNSPTQPSSYAVGKSEILNLRRDEERRLGPKFDRAKFHEKLLSSGTIPFKLMKMEFAAG